MIKNGVYSLKKHNHCIFQKLYVIFLFCLITVFVSGCKTVPDTRVVSAVELLDDESAFYIAIPSSVDRVLIQKIIKNYVPTLSDANMKMICDKIDTVYCGISNKKNQMDFQCVISGNIPVNMMPKVLTKKNGWNSAKIIPQDSATQYNLYSISNENFSIDMSFPSTNLAILGRDVPKMLSRFDFLSKLPSDDFEINTIIDKNLADFLNGAENEIRFCANKPQSFLTILTGAKLDLKLKEVSGVFVQDDKHENQYILDLKFHFLNDKYLKAGKTLLTLAFGLTNSQSIIVENNELQIKGIKLDKNQLIKLFLP